MQKDILNKKFIIIFLRSFFIQAVWNFKSMLSIGWTFTLSPLAKKMFGNREKYQDFLNRHLSFFNAHPYFASYAFGAIARLEEDSAMKGSGQHEQIEKFKNAIIGPLGAIGDQLFWAHIKPASIMVGFLGVLIFPELFQKLIFLCIFLILYNIPHIYIRYSGIVRGYNEGLSIYRKLRIESFSGWQKVYSLIGALAFSIVVAYLINQSMESDLIEIPMFAMSFGVAYFLRSRKRMTYLPVFIPLLIAIVIGILL
ncbi:MAG: PTS system mannose/fructose/sorbose family transporter subunit IID [Calditrichaceae bacterium]|nr:PTS system mannose/fructose/sorbose family transporter subunit IID [Calditrichaceae bacterium]